MADQAGASGAPVFVRGKQSNQHLKLTSDRKVSPTGWYQKSRNRWVPQTPNSFGLPAGDSCPGRTPFCDDCYAVGNENSSGVRDLVEHNLRLLQSAGSVEAMAKMLAVMVRTYLAVANKQGLPKKDRIFRIHWDGDFFSVEYALAWAIVIAMFPEIQFFAYTRSFLEPVNAIAALAEVAKSNLSLYLSTDEWNSREAHRMVEQYPQVHLAYCTVDYNSGRELAGGRPVMVCPENKGKMELMEDGRGACVECQLCPEGKRDVIFSTSHLDDVNIPMQPILWPSEDTPPATLRQCANTECNNLIPHRPGRGRPLKYCCQQCRWQAYRSRSKSAQQTQSKVIAKTAQPRLRFEGQSPRQPVPSQYRRYLLANLRAVSEWTGRWKVVETDLFNYRHKVNPEAPSVGPYARVFGSLPNARVEAGLDPEHPLDKVAAE